MHVEQITLAPGAPAVGRSLAETELRSRTGALVLSVRRRESDIATPDATFRLAAGDVVVVVGQPQQLRGARRLLTGAESV
jgi:TrkA domain protein